jgi:hypothetical protein
MDVVRLTRVRPFRRAKKVKIWVYFSRSGIENAALLQSKETFDRDFFVKTILSEFDKEWMRNCPRKCFRATFFHRDNAIPYRAPRDFDCFGITKFLHPSYSQNIAPCYFWLFGTLKRKLEGSTFGDPLEVSTAVNIIRSTIPLDEFISVFNEWKYRLPKCIDREEEYL